MIIITKLLLFVIITLTIILVLMLHKVLLKLKTLSTSQLNYLFLEIEKEKIISENLKKVKPSLTELNNNTQIKLNTIRVKLLNIDFTITEILK